MKRTILALIIILGCTGLARGQSTTVSGNITDAGSQAWVGGVNALYGGTYTFTFVPNPQFPTGPYTWTGGAFNPNQTIGGLLDASGNYNQSLPSNTAISPQGSKWVLQVCPQATSPCFTGTPTVITGISQTLNLTPPAISISLSAGSGQFTTAYADGEIASPPPLGGVYFNTISLVQRIWNGSAWVNGSGGGGGGNINGTGTINDLAKFTAAQVIGNSAWTDNGTASVYGGASGISTNSVTFTGTAPFQAGGAEGLTSSCNTPLAGSDFLCWISDQAPDGLYLSNNGGPYQPVATGLPVATPISNNQLLTGGGVVCSTTALTCVISAASYTIQTTTYTSPQTTLTLAAADPTNPRIDTIIVDNTGTASVLTGTPAGSPSAPVPNPVSQLAVSFVLVNANATAPSITTILVYDENVGTPTEWNCTPTANLNCNSTNNPFHGTKDIEATAAIATNNVVLANTSTVNLSTYSTFSFNIRNKAVWPKAKSISICFLNGSTIVGNCVGFNNGTFGFNQSNVSSYQQIVIPLANFALSGVVDRVRFQITGSGGGIGFYLDLIQLQTGLGGGGTGNSFQLQVDGLATATVANLKDSASVTFASSVANGVTTVTATAIGAPPSGAAGGDLSGTYPNPTVVKVNGAAVPTSATVLGSNGSNQLIAAALQGNGTKAQLSTGTTTTNDCVKFDANGNTVDAGAACGTTSGTVTNVATTSPITGGPITTTGTIACATCVTSAASLTSGQLMTGAGSQGSQVGNLSGDVTTSGSTATTIANNAVTAAKSAVVLTRRTCSIVIGADNGSALADADIGPQGSQCFVAEAGTIVEVDVKADGGTPSGLPRKEHGVTNTSLLSGALATAASGAIACSNTGGTTGLDGTTTCTNTLTTTSLAAGDFIGVASGTAGGTAKRFTIHITWTVN